MLSGTCVTFSMSLFCRICRSCTRTFMAWKRFPTWGNISSGTSVFVWGYFHYCITERMCLTLFISFAGWCVRQFDMNSMKLMRFYTSEYPSAHGRAHTHTHTQDTLTKLSKNVSLSRSVYQSFTSKSQWRFCPHTHICLLSLSLSQTQTHTDICLVLSSFKSVMSIYRRGLSF